MNRLQRQASKGFILEITISTDSGAKQEIRKKTKMINTYKFNDKPIEPPSQGSEAKPNKKMIK